MRSFKDDTSGAGLISFILPITGMFFIVLILHQLPKLGVGVDPILLEPVFDLWLIFVGVLISVCAYMRQFFILFLASILSFIGTVAIYVLYVVTG